MYHRSAFLARGALLPLALLAGCASPSRDYPSLGIRETERIAGTIDPVRPAAYIPPAPPATVLGGLEALSRAAADAHQAFLAQAPRTTTIVERARGAEVGSDRWAQAEVALGSLTASRSLIMEPLAELDRLLVDAAVEGQALEEISAVRDAVQAQVAEEDATIDRLLQVLARDGRP